MHYQHFSKNNLTHKVFTIVGPALLRQGRSVNKKFQTFFDLVHAIAAQGKRTFRIMEIHYPETEKILNYSDEKRAEPLLDNCQSDSK